jgi:hypothetical protein
LFSLPKTIDSAISINSFTEKMRLKSLSLNTVFFFFFFFCLY